MSYKDQYRIRTVRTWKCDGCDVEVVCMEHHAVADKDVYSGQVSVYRDQDTEALEKPVGWAEARIDGSVMKDFHSRQCAEAYAAKRIWVRSEGDG